MIRTKRTPLLLALLSASLIGGSAHADVVAASTPLGSMYGIWSNNAGGQNFLVQFTLASDTTLTGFDLFTGRSYANVGTGVTVKIRADNGSGLPGTSLAQFNDVIDAETAYDSFVDISSVHFAGPTLAAGTYWMGVSGLASELSWATYFGASSSPTGQAQLNGDTYMHQPGVYNFAWRIEGEPATGNNVPEPASWGLAAVALAGLAISRRRAAR